jgi:outer membrane protein assembly factor BamB
LLTLPLAAANDWPEWRGPNRDGCSPETGLLKAWPAGGPALLWKATGLGLGYATVATAGDRILTMGDKGDSSRVLALNRADGRPLWSAKVGKTGAPGWGNFAGPRGTPTINGDLVFAVGQWGDFVCVDAATGQERWRKRFEKDFGGSRPEWGFSESPLVDGDQVVVTPGGSRGAIVALNKTTGQTLWQSKGFTDPAHYSSLIAVEIGGVRQYIQLTEKSVVGVAAADGRVLWQAPRKGATAVIPTPVYHDGLVYVTSGYGVGCNLFKVTESAGKFTATEEYANKVMANHHGGVVRVGEQIYGYSEGKGWTCQNLRTGKDLWTEKSKLGKGSLFYADGHLYLRSEAGKGTVALIEASPSGYTETGRFDQPNRTDKNSWTHPVISDGKLYLRDQDVLLCYDVRAK